MIVLMRVMYMYLMISLIISGTIVIRFRPVLELHFNMQDRQKRRARAGLVHVSRVTPGEYRSCVHPTQKRERTRVVLVPCVLLS